MLEPTNTAEIARLDQRLQQLTAVFNGQIVDRVHLTCQRLDIPDENKLAQLVAAARDTLANTRPFPLTAVSLNLLYLPNPRSPIL
ncbi:MAG: hypothetical protein GY950_27120, partial [bacterium]|nr:hypothetical protein [bacterium]